MSHFFQARFFSGGQTDFAEFIKQPKDGNALCSLRERERGKEEGKREREREKGKTDNARTDSERVLSEREKEREKENQNSQSRRRIDWSRQTSFQVFITFSSVNNINKNNNALRRTR